MITVLFLQNGDKNLNLREQKNTEVLFQKQKILYEEYKLFITATMQKKLKTLFKQ